MAHSRSRIALTTATAATAATLVGLAWWGASSPQPAVPAGLAGSGASHAHAPGSSERLSPAPIGTALATLPARPPVVHRPDLSRRVLGAERPSDPPHPSATAPRSRDAGPSQGLASRAATPLARKGASGRPIASDDRPRHLREKEPSSATTTITQTGETVRVVAPGHTVEFAADGVVFTPHDRRGVSAPASRLGLSLTSVRRGEHVLWAGGACAPVLSSNHVTYERAPGLRELFLLSDRSAQQLFSLATVPPGAAEEDLVLSTEVDTALLARPTPRGGLHFEGPPGQPGVTVSKAVVCDALGRTLDVPLVLAGSTLDLRVPGDWLAEAQGPLLIDPILTSDFAVTFFVDDEETPALAYNRLNNEFVVVVIHSGSNLVVSRLSGDGAVLQGGVILDGSGDAKERPAICWSSPAANRYLVAYRRAGDVYVVVIDRTLSIVSAAARIFDPTGDEDQDNPAVAFDSARSSWLVVWDDDSQSASRDILGERVLTSGAQQGTVILRNLTAVLGDPAASYSETSDRFLVTFNSDSDLAGAVIDGAVTTLTAAPTISALTNTQNKSAIAWSSHDDQWLVVFQSDDWGDDDVIGRFVSNAGALVGSTVLSGFSGEDEQDPAVSYLAATDTYLIGYDRLNASGAEWNVWAREHTASGSAVAAAFQASESPEATSHEVFTAIAANSVQEEWLQVWQDGRALTDYDVFGQRYSSDTAAPRVVRFRPQHDATGVPLDAVLLADFSQPMNAATITGTNVKVYQAGVTEITTATVTYLAGTRQAQLTVAGEWPTNQSLRVVVGAAAANTLGVTLGTAAEATFETGDALSLPDADGDGLLDAEEALLGTDPNDVDSDADGLSDSYELTVSFTDPLNADTDGDSTLDGSDPTPNGTPANPALPPDPLPVADLIVTRLHPQGTFGSRAHVPPDVLLAVTFNNPVDIGSVTSSNVLLEDQTTFALVNLQVVGQPNPQTIVVEPTSALVSGRTYVFSVIDGGTAIEDTAGQHVSVGADTVFEVETPTANGFEPRHYLATLDRTQWEVFPLTAPTAGGAALVVPATRKLLLTETDVVTPGRGLPVALTRTYRNNDDAASGLFGANWHFTYDRGFEVIADQNGDGRRDLRFRTSDGRLFTYLSGATTQAKDYQDPPGFFETTKALTIGGKKLFVTRDRHGLEHMYEFHEPGDPAVEDPDALPLGARGLLVRIRDRNHNTIVINRHAADHGLRPDAIDTIVDDLDRTTTFTYSTTSGQEHLCVEVAQWSGLGSPRSWLYSYDGDARLERVETPPSDFKLENGSLATSTRKAREYTYSTLGSGPGATELLTSLEDGRGNVTLRVFYDSVGDVLQVDHGAGADVGTALFSYRLDPAIGMNRATQVDRSGNVLELTHEDFTIADTWLIATSAVYTRGLHPTLPSGEQPGYLTEFFHDTQSQIVECVSPGGTVERLIRCTACGCPKQCIRKAATWDELLFDGAAKAELDLVTIVEYDDAFHFPTRVIEARGNNAAFVGTTSSVVDALENVSAQTPRTFKNIDAAKRNAYTTFLYYDHENVAARLAADSTAIGDTVTFARAFPETYGRTAVDTYRDPPGAVFDDDDGDGYPDRGGNLYAIRGPRPRVLDPGSGAFAMGRQVIEQNFTYNQYGQRVLSIDPVGDRTRLEWFVGAFDLTNNPNRGYLKKVVVATEYADGDFDLATGVPDAGPSGSGLELATSLTHDPFGNPLTVTNPRGFTTTSVVNALNLVTKTTSAAPFSYERELFHDGNNNLVEVRVQNVVATDSNDDGLQGSGEQAEVMAHADFVHTYAYSSANRLARQDLDAFGSTPSVLTTVYGYDAMQRLTSIREPEGNVHVRRHDERGLLYEEVQGANDSLTSRTTRYDYDPDGNLLQVVDDDGNSDPQVVITYDAFQRPVAWEDELGNRVEVTLDVGGFTRQVVARGQARGDPGDPFTSVLSNSLTEFDEAGRPFQSSAELFGAVETLAAQSLSRLTAPVDLSASRVASGELVAATVAYDALGRALATRDDNGHATAFTYDAASRLASVTDALLSSVSYTYDAASNVIRTTEVEVTDDGADSETFYTEAYFDELDRLIATVSHLGSTRRLLYDSRGNVLQVSDAMGGTSGLDLDDLPTSGEHGTFPQFAASDPAAVTAVNARGNTTRLAYDGLSRLLSTTRDLRVDGTGATAVAGTIVTQTAWDGNSRVVGRTDPNGNTTTYAFDNQNRPIGEVFADLTFSLTTYHRVGTVASVRDPRGVLQQFAYDALERPTGSTTLNLPPGPGQTTFKAWRWDGLSRRTRAEDDDTIVERHFDSLSREVQDVQRIATGAPRTSSAQSLQGELQGTFGRVFDGVGNVLKQHYPSAHTITRTYDEVDRLVSVADGSTVATYEHTGQGARRLSRTYPVPGITQSLAYDAERRVTRLDAVRTSTSQRIRGFAYAWDREHNRRFERRLTVNTNPSEAGGDGEFYRYDSAYRLAHDDRDVASASLNAVANNAATVTSPAIDVSKATTYMLDQAGNRRQLTVDASTSVYQLADDAQTADLIMNQYTRVGSAYQTHDLAGNTLSSSERGLQRFFDVDNRLVRWTEGAKDIRYRYDADGRRVLKHDVNSSFAPVVYFYDGWHDAEETTTAGVVTRRYVYGENVDEPLRVTLPDVADVDGDMNTSELVDLYYHHSSLGSVVALTTAGGAVVESYRYSAYGEPAIFDQSGSEVATTQVEQPFMFTGRRWDFEEESGLYYYRLRYYDPAAGRFVSRDPLGLWGDPSQRGNGQGYCGNNPVNTVDPYGDRIVVDTAGMPPKDARDFQRDVEEGLKKIKDDLQTLHDQLEKELEDKEDEIERREGVCVRAAANSRPARVQRDALDRLKRAEEERQALLERMRRVQEMMRRLEEMIDSPKEIRVRRSGNLRNRYNPRRDWPGGANDQPGVIEWNPDSRHGGQSEDHSNIRDPHIGLAHELSHAYDDTILEEPAEVRHGPPDDGDRARWKNRTEKRAVELENDVRAGNRASSGRNTPADREHYYHD